MEEGTTRDNDETKQPLEDDGAVTYLQAIVPNQPPQGEPTSKTGETASSTASSTILGWRIQKQPSSSPKDDNIANTNMNESSSLLTWTNDTFWLWVREYILYSGIS